MLAFALVALALCVAVPVAGAAEGAAKVSNAKKAKRGPRGKQGKKGKRGQRGARGETGEKGEKGERGERGEPGAFAEVLPAGRTLRGIYEVSGTATAAGQFFSAPISFPFPTVKPPLVNFVSVPTLECPGGVAEPQAAPGNLCVYIRRSENFDQILSCDPVADSCDSSSRFGVLIQVRSREAGRIMTFGSWAVTG